MKRIFRKKNIYLDYAGAAPICDRVLKEMKKYEKGFFANPTAIYSDGVKVREIIEDARRSIASLLNAHNDEIVFTGSGTESNALAIIGLITNYELQIKNENAEYKIPHIITSNIEHPAVLKNFEFLEKRGEAEVSYIKVNKDGLVNPKDVRDALRDNTILVSIMYANNEIGTIQPIEEIAKILRRFRKMKCSKECSSETPWEHDGVNTRNFSAEKYPCISEKYSLWKSFPVLHTDACQAMNYLFTENIEKLGVDLLSFNSSKIYGPKGIGVIYKKRNIQLSPIYQGGDQEFGLRSGTENVAQIVGVKEALKVANELKDKEVKRLSKFRDYFIEKIPEIIDETGYEIILNGDREKRLPNNINISIPKISSELLVIELSALGIFVSEKSACKSDDGDASYVVNALKNSSNQDSSNHSIRISMGRDTKKKDIDILVKSIKRILNKYSKLTD